MKKLFFGIFKKTYDNLSDKNFYIENKWIIAASVFFIAWKFFLVHIVLKSSMATSSDALYYIKHIDSINQCSYLVLCKEFALSFKNYFGFEHLSYRLFFGFLAKLFNLDSTRAFYLSFYVGIVVLLPCIIFFLKRIETNKNLIALLIFFLALYNGGSYHGFFWVVPSFFATMLILLIFGLVLEKHRHWKALLLVLVPMALYTHTISLYLMVVIVFFYFLDSFFNRRFDREMLKRILFMVFVIFITFVPVSLYLKGNPFGPETLVSSSITKITNDNSTKIALLGINRALFPGFDEIRKSYFDILFFRPPFIIVFVYVIFLLFYYKKFKILSLYFSALLFTMISSINENGLRSLILTWPFTYILYAYGLWLSFKFADEYVPNKKARLTIKILICIGTVGFVILNILYSYFLDRDGLTNIQKFLNI